MVDIERGLATKQLDISPGEHRPHRKKFRQDKQAD